MTAAWVTLIVVGMLLGGVVLVVALLCNRHTRGVAKAMLAAGAVLLLLLVGSFLLVRTTSHVRTNETQALAQAHQAQAEHARAMAEQQAEEMRRLAEAIERQGGEDARQQAEQMRQDGERIAEQYREDARRWEQQATASGSSSHVERRAIWSFGLLSPLALLLYGGVVFIAFKHGGAGVGTAAVVLPMLLLSYLWMGVSKEPVTRATNHGPARGQYLLEAPPPAVGHEPEVQVPTEVPEPETSVLPDDSNATDSDSDSIDESESSPDGEAAESSTDAEKDTSEEPAPAQEPPSPIVELPDWVRSPPKSVENVDPRVVASGWYDSAETCQERIEDPLKRCVEEYVRDLATEETRRHAYVPPLERLGITERFIRDQLVRDQFYQMQDFGHAEGMVNLHVLVEFDHATTEYLRESWRSYARQGRIEAVTMAMVAVLGSLAGILGLVKLDTYTKGYYTKRLFIGVPAAIIGVILLLGALDAYTSLL